MADNSGSTMGSVSYPDYLKAAMVQNNNFTQNQGQVRPMYVSLNPLPQQSPIQASSTSSGDLVQALMNALKGQNNAN